MVYYDEIIYESHREISHGSFLNQLKASNIFKYFLGLCEIWDGTSIALVVGNTGVSCKPDEEFFYKYPQPKNITEKYLCLKISYSDHEIHFDRYSKELFIRTIENKKIPIDSDIWKLKDKKVNKCIEGIIKLETEDFQQLHEYHKKLLKIDRNLFVGLDLWGGQIKINGKLAGWSFEKINRWLTGFNSGGFEGLIAKNNGNKITINLSGKIIDLKKYQLMKAFI